MLPGPLAFVGRAARRGLTELVIAPSEIRTSDPTRADDIYGGYLLFGGRLVNAQGRSPFDIAPPTLEFARELGGFGWLRHMRAAGTSLSRSNAQALITDFLRAEPRLRSGATGEPAVVARRILSWLSQAPFLLHGANADFYRAFMRGLSRDARTLARGYPAAVGVDRLLAGIALTQLALCADLGAAALKRTASTLAEETSRQIFADGGHVGRNPETLVDLLLDLLPLRQTFAARNQPAPQALLNAIDRMIPMLRLLRHGEGSLALFNGMGVTEPDHLATVLAYSDSRGRALLNAPHAGYQRLESGGALLVVDAGAPPPLALSAAAGAGCSSFEFSVGRERIVINCGAPPPGKPVVRAASRQTAAHSTLVLDDVSSCRFARTTGLERFLSGAIMSGPRVVSVERREQPDATILEIAHDGYVRTFGLRHSRRLALARDGKRLTGEDRLELVAGRAERAATRFDIRFHLHPGVTVHGEPNGGPLQLVAGAERLIFEATGAAATIEESVLFAAPTGSQRTRQVVLAGHAVDETTIRWSFTQS